MKKLALIFSFFLICSCGNYKSIKSNCDLNIDAIYKSWIENSSEYYKDSLRYRFLEKLKNQYFSVSEFYIIDSPISGEFYLPRIWIMCSYNKKSTDVLAFEFKNKNWEFVNSFRLPYRFQYNQKEYLRKNGKEFNWNDVTVSHVVNNQVIRSDFFAKGTMKKFVFELPEKANHF